MVVVLRTVDASAPAVVGHRRVDDDGCRRETAVDGRRVDDRLEGRSQLAVRLNRAVELATVEAPASDQRLDLSCAIVDGNERAFDQRRLFEAYGERGGSLVDRRWREYEAYGSSRFARHANKVVIYLGDEFPKMVKEGEVLQREGRALDSRCLHA